MESWTAMRLKVTSALPAVVIAGATVALLASPEWAPATGPAAGPLLFGGALVTVVLGFRFHRLAASLLAALLVMAGDVLSAGALFPLGSPGGLREPVIVLLPVVYAVLALLPERRWSSPAGLARWLLLPALAVAGVVLAREPWAEVRAAFGAEFFDVPEPVGSALALPDAALVSWLLAGVVLGVLAWRRRTPLALMTAAAWVPLLGATLAPAGQVPLHLGLAMLALLVGILEQAYVLAYRDELTGLPARRALMELLQRVGARYTVAMLDVDHFKKFNDTWGHDIGDDVLRRVASCMETVGGGGRAFRYGGEEFTVVFPGRSAQHAEEHLETLRKAVADARLTVTPKTKRGKVGKRQKTLSVTISIGLAESGDETEHPLQVIKSADEALYRAKEGGRNRVSR